MSVTSSRPRWAPCGYWPKRIFRRGVSDQDVRQAIDLGAVDVDTVVSEALSRHKVAADKADISITTDAATGYRVLGDQNLLVTAVANLVSNAIAYSPNGSGISISRRRRGGSVEIAVTDRGIGIAKADQERVFERFAQATTPGAAHPEGAGLGLAIVAAIADGHGGRVHVASTPGVGSPFTLDLPLVPVPGAAPATADAATPYGATAPTAPTAPSAATPELPPDTPGAPPTSPGAGSAAGTPTDTRTGTDNGAQSSTETGAETGTDPDGKTTR